MAQELKEFLKEGIVKEQELVVPIEQSEITGELAQSDAVSIPQQNQQPVEITKTSGTGVSVSKPVTTYKPVLENVGEKFKQEQMKPKINIDLNKISMEKLPTAFSLRNIPGVSRISDVAQKFTRLKQNPVKTIFTPSNIVSAAVNIPKLVSNVGNLVTGAKNTIGKAVTGAKDFISGLFKRK